MKRTVNVVKKRVMKNKLNQRTKAKK